MENSLLVKNTSRDKVSTFYSKGTPSRIIKYTDVNLHMYVPKRENNPGDHP